ncbi:tRNA (guanosine(46)-N7)-methyltransferase TrmB [Leptolyngbya cf. ectocarpi LEGE 11479]|uniref:tRNA (guanine-N(7)-)-methyltransferase n=1 Tax=Leptolyngbya cf. ectocarpi LEGE 11479 TaxID=1828722 RepID=A0A928X2W5_LEPEC|nr:tRNA (guanosine(46)-N7)-methyltransferase TrmB [Leptolyngbya ectocarpi]MBE9066063.1 tRNA (guanosine(46)-N7)-methyltransferase TrmB [Leptolyngbya cf. ectocarpi LEGE 11479]
MSRVRQHVNPLNNRYSTPVTPPRWADVYANPQQPLHIDIGSAKGYFISDMAQLCPDWNFLGLEIREPLVEQCLRECDRNGLRNLHALFCNANNSLRPLLASLPQPPQRVSIQFPDPWFKKRHQKRRVVQPQLVSDLAEFMPEGAWVWLQSDVELVAEDMVNAFADNPQFQRELSDPVPPSTSGPWLTDNPLPAMTDRERVTLDQGKPVYRALFIKAAALPSPSPSPIPRRSRCTDGGLLGQTNQSTSHRYPLKRNPESEHRGYDG